MSNSADRPYHDYVDKMAAQYFGPWLRKHGIAFEESSLRGFARALAGYHERQAALAHLQDASAGNEENLQLRRLLMGMFMGSQLYLAYTDDGEMQDSRVYPPIDFRRDSPSRLREAMGLRGASDAKHDRTLGKVIASMADCLELLDAEMTNTSPNHATRRQLYLKHRRGGNIRDIFEAVSRAMGDPEWPQ